MSLTMSKLTVTKLNPYIGAEIGGVDLSQPVDAETAAEIKRLWLENVILLFRGQTLGQEDLIRVTGIFGKLGAISRPKEFRPSGYKDMLEGVMLISNIRENGEPIGALPDGEMMYHHDMIHKATPHSATLLYSVEVPKEGGNTMFANCERAYETLPAALKAKLEGRQARHLYKYGTVQRGDANKQAVSAYAEATHPIIRTHDETGRKAIYANRLMTEEIVGMPKEESDATLEAVFNHAENREWVYEHVWKPGDLIIWDNRNSMHARTDFPFGERRLLLRTTVDCDVKPY